MIRKTEMMMHMESPIKLGLYPLKEIKNALSADLFHLSLYFKVTAKETWKKHFMSNWTVSDFDQRLKSAKNRFQLSAGLNLEAINTILSRTNHIWAAAQILKIGLQKTLIDLKFFVFFLVFFSFLRHNWQSFLFVTLLEL